MEEKDKDGLKITNQFRAKGGMAYDLKCKGARITVHVSQRSTQDDQGDWCVEARANRPAQDAIVVTEWGPTRVDALRAVGRSWASNTASQGMAMFDWDAVAEVLHSVRAL